MLAQLDKADALSHDCAHEVVAAREQLQRILDGATNVAIIAADTQGLMTVFNRGAENMLGYKAEEMVGKHTPCVFHLESEMAARGQELSREAGRKVEGNDVFVERARNGQPDEREWTYVRKDGEHLTVNLVVTALKDAFGTITGFLGVAMDISARKRAEVAARANDEHFRLLVGTIQDYALTMLDPTGHVISWNLGAERISGYSADEVVGRHFSCFYTPEDVVRSHAEGVLEGAAKQGCYTEEGFRVRKDKSRFWASVSVSPVSDPAGKLLGFAKVTHDITSRKAAEQSLRQQALLLDLAHESILIRDSEDRITYWNQGAERFYGWSKEEAVGQVTHHLLQTKFPQPLAEIEAELRNTGYWDGELTHTQRDGALVTVASSWVLQRDDSSGSISVMELNHDITQRKLAERQVEERNAELKAVNKELEEFAYVASHDLKAPLRVINNVSKWLEKDLQGNLVPNTRDNLNLLRNRVKRMDKLLDDLLEYACIGRTTDNRFTETIDGRTLMQNVRGLLGPTELTVRVSSSFAGIQVCRMPLQQILLNLIGNAIKHHDKKIGTIDVSVADTGDTYTFEVKDDGPGIPVEYQDQVFQMFQTLRPRDQVEGSGMGLAMVRKNIEVFGGALRLVSAEGEGSTFTFTWPKRQQLVRVAA